MLGIKIFGRNARPDKFLSKEELKKIEKAVHEAEAKTSGEIRVKIISHLTKGINDTRNQAIYEFYNEGMQNTRDKTGVLILLVLSKHGIEIVADSGINTKVKPGTWDAVIKTMSATMRGKREHCEAICAAVETVGEILSRQFPRKPDDTDELPNTVIVDKG